MEFTFSRAYSTLLVDKHGSITQVVFLYDETSFLRNNQDKLRVK